MNWIANSLNRKFILGTTSGLAFSSLVFLLLYIPLYESELEGARADTANQVNNLLQVSLENAMLKRDLPGLSEMVKKLGAQEGIVTVFITTPAGEIRFSSREGDFGRQLEDPYRASRLTTRFTRGEGGLEVLRSINPVHNKPPCKECHGPAEQNPINGILYVDYDALPLRTKVRNTTLMLMGAGALIVILNLIGGWWFIHSHILRPVSHLTHASREMTRGNLQARVSMHGSDELSKLGDTFDLMAERLREKLSELEEQKGFLQALVDAIPDGIRIIDDEFRIILINKAYREQHKLPDQGEVGAPCYGITHNAAKPCPPTLTSCPVHEIRQIKKPIKVVHQHYRSDLSTFEVEIFAAPMEITQGGREKTLVVESIRDLAKAVNYSQEQKLSELGRLATGVAHEIHNPLASVKLALDATKNTVDADANCPDSISQHLELIDEEINTCIKITGKLLKLGSPPPENLELVDINNALHETLSLLKWQAEQNNINIEEFYEEKLLRSLASDSEIRMVALNLAQNAFHAMPEGGILTVTAQTDGKKIIIHFSDTGAGIRAKDLPYIFDPFFSRRADDVQGTGLGLSISLAIVEKYGGTIRVESEFSAGSVFTVELPDAGQELEGDL
ncbi:MAG: histidine kinase [gamma proteobacterium symbiont of Ctena orbiculata]|nr:MAG: histidine kinase [gamma proteobacterium symbiont of Ctena orbiculata]PUB75908.1 MAG: histidine kinase [gamma proteobacterium symbiont of Ctena orbiculata]